MHMVSYRCRTVQPYTAHAGDLGRPDYNQHLVKSINSDISYNRLRYYGITQVMSPTQTLLTSAYSFSSAEETGVVLFFSFAYDCNAHECE